MACEQVRPITSPRRGESFPITTTGFPSRPDASIDSSKCCKIGFPATGVSAFGMSCFMRVPFPAARMTMRNFILFHQYPNNKPEQKTDRKKKQDADNFAQVARFFFFIHSPHRVTKKSPF